MSPAGNEHTIDRAARRGEDPWMKLDFAERGFLSRFTAFLVAQADRLAEVMVLVWKQTRAPDNFLWRTWGLWMVLEPIDEGPQ